MVLICISMTAKDITYYSLIINTVYILLLYVKRSILERLEQNQGVQKALVNFISIFLGRT